MEYQVYTIGFGESLASIAKKFTGNPWRFVDIVKANPQLPRDYFDHLDMRIPTLKDIRVGQKIRIPGNWVPGGPMVVTGVGNVGVSEYEATAAGLGAGMVVLGITSFILGTAGTVGGIWFLVDKIRGK